jgi:hypothetical protein
MAALAREPALGTLQQFTNKAEELINQEEIIKALTRANPENPQSQPNDVKRESKASSGRKRKNARSPDAF